MSPNRSNPASLRARRLRPAIEAALRVARQGEEDDPPEPAPPALRRYLRFSRLPAPALEAARRVIDEDADFRARVVAATSVDEVGESGWLWLARPDGWEHRLDELAGDAERRREHASAAREERSASRRIAELEEAKRRADAVAETNQRLVSEARAELDAERVRRRASESRVHALEAAVAAGRSDLAAAQAQLAAAQAELAAAHAELAARRAEVDRSQREVARLGNELAHVRARLPENDAGEALAGAAPASGTAPGPRPEPAGPRIDVDAIARAVARATASLEEAASLLSAPTPYETTASQPVPGDVVRARSAATPAGVRRPVKLPGGVLDDRVEAAEHLLRVPDVVLLVDGYNISNALAPGRPIQEQRTRLLDALRELQARTGAAVEVVFDGAPLHDPWVAGAGARSPVHVRFSPAGVEADDVLVDRIVSLPASRPVILATSDRDLRDRARRRGANLLGAKQLLGAMRR